MCPIQSACRGGMPMPADGKRHVLSSSFGNQFVALFVSNTLENSRNVFFVPRHGSESGSAHERPAAGNPLVRPMSGALSANLSRFLSGAGVITSSLSLAGRDAEQRDGGCAVTCPPGVYSY